MRTLPFLIVLIGCATEAPEPTATCNSCHGSEETNAWPPVALGGITDPTARGVGAHGAHQFPSLSDPVACEECHLVPSTVDAEGHIDTPWPAETKWGDLAKTDGAEVTWNAEALTCSGAYCHGGTMVGGLDTEPVWTAPRGTQIGCDSCHAFPPPAPHPDGTSCGDCHGETATGTSLTNASTHIDGIVQLDGVTPGSCSDGCHGGPNQTHPPEDTSGNTDTTEPGVGAHESHMGATLGAPVACESCHPVPASVNEGVHLDSNVDVVFGGIANNDGVTSSYDAGAFTCTTYCHGESLGGGGASAPIWTLVDGSQATCGSCHGNPPPPPHPANPNCGNCHDGGSGNPANHIDGNVDF